MNSILKCAFISLVFISLVCQGVIAQSLTRAQQDFLSQYAISIEVDENYENGRWQPILEAVKNKKIVCLGEFNHGSKEVFTTRNELIRNLHEQLGFNVILFESGFGEVGVINLNKKELHGESRSYGFFSGWRNKAFEELVGYATDNDITIAGFDVQRTGSVFTSWLTAQLEEPAPFKDMEQRFVKIKSKLSNYRTVYDSVSTATQSLIREYEALRNQFEARDEFITRTLANRITFLRYMLAFAKDKDWNQRWKARDAAMADNVIWLQQRYGSDEKIIIIAHNFHISRYNEKEEVMGEFLKVVFDDDMYVMGVFAKDGTYHDNAGKEKSMSKPDSLALDIKHIIQADNTTMSFLDIPDDTANSGAWLSKPIIVNNTFIDLSGSNEMIMSKCFDGLLLLDRVSPPD
ncbi:MAG: erythromycin esterase family protein [Bacteroidota bacterium]